MNKEDKIITIPNILSIVRLLMIPFIVWQYVVDHFWTAIILLFASGLTDVCDGIIARKFNMISTAGKILDPLADKLTQVAVIICLSVNHPEFMLLVVIFCAKEFAMLLGATQLFKLGKRPSESKWWGKMTTVVLYLIVGIIFLIDAFGLNGFDPYITILVLIGCICVVFALFQYYPIFRAIISGKYDVDSESYVDERAVLNKKKPDGTNESAEDSQE